MLVIQVIRTHAYTQELLYNNKHAFWEPKSSGMTVSGWKGRCFWILKKPQLLSLWLWTFSEEELTDQMWKSNSVKIKSGTGLDEGKGRDPVNPAS